MSQACNKCGVTKPLSHFHVKKRQPSKNCEECRSSYIKSKKELMCQQNKEAIAKQDIDQDLLKMWFCFQADIDTFNAPLYEILPHVMASS